MGKGVMASYCRDCHWRHSTSVREGRDPADKRETPPGRWLCAASPTDRIDGVTGEGYRFERCYDVRRAKCDENGDCPMFQAVLERDE